MVNPCEATWRIEREGSEGQEVGEMSKHRGGEMVPAGTYWNVQTGGLVELGREGALPGNEGSAYLRMPFSVAFVLVIALGGLYVVSFPLLIIGMSVYVAAVRILGGIAYQVRRTVSFGWRPTEAYLAGKKKKVKKGK